MPKVHELRQKRAGLVDEMRALVTGAETAGRDLNDQESTRFDAAKAEIVELDRQIQRAETIAELERRTTEGQHVAGDVPFQQLEQRVSVLNVLQHLVDPMRNPLGGAEAEYSREMARRSGRQPNGVFIPFAAIERRATMTTTVAPEIVPIDHRPDLYIDAFRAALISNRLGVRVLTGLQGDVAIPRRGNGVSVGWVAEDQALPDTSMDFDSVGLSPKHCGAIVELSRQLILQSSPDIEQLVRSDLAQAMAAEVDRVMIDGGAVDPNEPTGIIHTSGVLQGSLATPTYGEVVDVIGLAEDNNTPGPLQWIVSPKGARKLRTTQRTNVADTMLMQGGQLGELPALSTSFVPETDATHGAAILGAFNQILLGIWGALDLSTNPYAELPYRKGNVLVRAISSLDIGVRDPSAFVVADDIPV